MKTMVVGLGLMLSSMAFAAPVGKGNFRRAEALQAARADKDSKARVVGLTTARGAQANPKSARLLFVEHASGKVDIIKAPLDRSKAVSMLSTKEANRLGVITQAQAKKMASQNGGMLGQDGKVTLKSQGIGAKRGSYKFAQTAPKTRIVEAWGGKYRAKFITRTVTVAGTGESASAFLDSLNN